MANQVILARADDGEDIAKSVRALLAVEPSLTITEDVSSLPEPWEPAIVLYLLTPGALEKGPRGTRNHMSE